VLGGKSSRITGAGNSLEAVRLQAAVVTYALCKLSRRKQKCPRIYLSLGEIGFEIAQQCSTLVVIVKVPIGFFISGVRVIVHSEIAAVVRQLDRVFFESDPLRKH